MVDFQLPEDMASQVKEHAISVAPQECCGVVLIKKGKRKYYPCTNISKELDSFVIDPLEFTRLSMQGDIEFIVHSHTSGNTPSEHDIDACNSLRIPYIIYYLETDSFDTYYHKNYNKLIGREYMFGEQDCFEAVRDWFLTHNVVMPPRRKWLDNWWEHGYNYISNEIFDWPVKQVKDLMYGDILALTVHGDVPNHIAVYLDDDIIYHHAVNRLSCRENMYPLWAENIHGIYRYKGSDFRRLSR
jgi:proteasome lid subunit RPN8/RPN11